MRQAVWETLTMLLEWPGVRLLDNQVGRDVFGTRLLLTAQRCRMSRYAEYRHSRKLCPSCFVE